MIVKIVMIVVKKYGNVLIVERNLIQKKVLYFMKIDIVEKKDIINYIIRENNY